MYNLKDGPERVFVKEELMLIPEDTDRAATGLCLKMVKTFPSVKMSFPTPEHVEQNKAQCGSILKW